MTSSPSDVTQLLLDWSNGDKAALDKLVPVVYEELRRLASSYMRHERSGHTLQTSALVNEAYMRLVDYRQMQWQSRAHFFAVAAQAMRRVLVDHARKQRFAKRGGGAVKVSLDESLAVSQKQAADLIALDDALTDLEAIDPRKSRIVELRYIGGLNIEETAEVLDISPATVQREWRAAKAWLYRAIKEGGTNES
ncbi:MAG TPA: sigma-70 family RNA polymerase sigma factor [Blastocatellia bacterium]|nr:sigma-70 family RNA polymerase sigma factor [Blastocatellia bacterium]